MPATGVGYHRKEIRRQSTPRRPPTTKGKAGAAREKAQKKAESAGKTKSATTANQRNRAAAREEVKAAKLDRKSADELKTSAKAGARAGKAEDAVRKAEQADNKRDDLADRRRRREELAHARRLANASNSGSRSIGRAQPVAKKEVLKLALLVASPTGEARIRVDQEAREILEVLKRSRLGSRVKVQVWPAATFDDVTNALNDDRPDVIHFSGHGSTDGLIFDGTDKKDPQGREFSYEYVGRALNATDLKPRLVVLNACYSFSGVDEILRATPALVAMTDSVTDIGAKAFGAKFYFGIGSGQSLSSAFEQAKLALDIVSQEGDKADLVVLDEVDPSTYRLIEPLPADED